MGPWNRDGLMVWISALESGSWRYVGLCIASAFFDSLRYTWILFKLVV